MTNNRPIPALHEPSTRPKQVLATITTRLPEDSAVLAGVQAGDAALARFKSSGVLMLFKEARGSDASTPRLLALRSYAELRRVLRSEGFDVPPTSLAAVGFTAAQIARFNKTIATMPPGCSGS